MREIRTYGAMSGDWKRSHVTRIEAPARRPTATPRIRGHRASRRLHRTSAVADRVLVVGSECLENAAFARRTPATDIRIEIRTLFPQRLSNAAGTVDETLYDRAQCTIL